MMNMCSASMLIIAISVPFPEHIYHYKYGARITVKTLGANGRPFKYLGPILLTRINFNPNMDK